MWPTYYIVNQEKLEGVPPPTYYLTTPPYPLELSDSLYTTGTQISLGFLPSAELEEQMTCQGLPISGNMLDLLERASVVPEDIISTGIPISGVLRDILQRYTGEPELIFSTGTPISGVLADPLRLYVNWPLIVDPDESLFSTGTPVSGTLT